MKIKNNLISETSLKLIIKKAKNRKPQFGNSRSFACNSKRKNWKCNKQKLNLNGKIYFLPQSEIKTIKKTLNLGPDSKSVN